MQLKILGLESELTDATEQITKLQSENNKLNSENIRLQSENDTLEAENSELQAKIESYKSYVSDASSWISSVGSLFNDIQTYLKRTAFSEILWDRAPASRLGRPLRFEYSNDRPANRQFWLQQRDGAAVKESIAGAIEHFRYEASGDSMLITFAQANSSSLGTRTIGMGWQDAAAATMYNFADYYYHTRDDIRKFVSDNPSPVPPESGALRE